jgi:hypothetical protein
LPAAIFLRRSFLGAAKLDVIGEIVNMFQPYPALRLAPLQRGYDDVR